MQHKTREDILRYYFDFLRVHPFGDSNLTVISIICDLECIRHGFRLFKMLDIRFKDKQFMYYFTAYHEKNLHIEDILLKILFYIDCFHDGVLPDEVLKEKNNQIVFSTAKLL